MQAMNMHILYKCECFVDLICSIHIIKSRIQTFMDSAYEKQHRKNLTNYIQSLLIIKSIKAQQYTPLIKKKQKTVV